MTDLYSPLQLGDEAFFDAVNACLPIGLFLADSEGRYTFTNANYQAMGGFTLSESLGEGWARFVHPEDRRFALSQWATAARAGRELTSELRFLTPNGIERRVVLRSAPLRGAGSELTGHLGTAEDVSQRKVAEAERAFLRSRELTARKAAWADRARYQGLFEAAGDAMLVANGEGSYLDVNQAATDLLGYTRDEFLQLRVPDIIAQETDWSEAEYARFTLEGTWRGELDVRAKDGSILRIDARATQVDLPTGTIYVSTLRDVTEQRRETRERERLMSGLAEASLLITSSSGLEDVLQVIVEQARSIIGAQQAAVSLAAITEWSEPVVTASLSDAYAKWRDFKAPPDGTGIYRLVTERNQPVRMTQDELEAHPMWQGFGQTAGEHPPLRGWLAVPLVARDGRNLGMLQLSDKNDGGEFDGEDEAVLVQLAQLASVAVENTRLYREAQDALEERDAAYQLLKQRVAALASVAAGLTFDRPLNTALQFLADNIVQASHATACLVGLSIEANTTYRFVGSSGLPERFGPALEGAIRSGGSGWITSAMRDRRLILTRDLRRTILDDPESRELHEFVRTANWDSAACLPLIYRDRILGMLIGFYQSGSELNSEEAGFFGAIGNQAAAAIESARLFSEAQGKAALEERQRLARELHDSISQVLYGIGIGATAIRDWLQVDPKQAVEPTDYVLSLVDAGIAEMRSLIFELRPESLAQEGLVAAINKQANVLKARNGLDIVINLGEEPDAPLDVKETLFRVGQEAMNNAAKHARASHAEVRLEAVNGRMALEVTDDGIGFDTAVRYPGHLGLQSMRERVERLNGTLNLKSAPGAGTRVRVELPISHVDAVSAIAL